jgi:uncharacterized protein (DUF697 family)
VAAPLPLSDLWLATPVHILMVVGVGRVYGRRLSRSEGVQLFTELVAAAGASVAARRLWVALSKFLLPGIGGWVMLPYVFAVTWALGRMAMVYFENPGHGTDGLRDKFGGFVAEGKKKFSYQAFKDFMRQQDAAGPAAAKEAPAGKPPSRKPPSRKQRARVVDAEPAVDAVEASWDDGPTSPDRPAVRESRRSRSTAAERPRAKPGSRSGQRRPASGRRDRRG